MAAGFVRAADRAGAINAIRLIGKRLLDISVIIAEQPTVLGSMLAGEQAESDAYSHTID